jgi:hypothetical protein
MADEERAYEWQLGQARVAIAWYELTTGGALPKTTPAVASSQRTFEVTRSAVRRRLIGSITGEIASSSN